MKNRKKIWIIVAAVLGFIWLASYDGKVENYDEIQEILGDSDYMDFELLEREYVVGESKEFDVPPGEVMFGNIKSCLKDSLLVECRNNETYKMEEYEVLLDEQMCREVRGGSLKEGDKIAVFYDEVKEGMKRKEIEPVYGIYLQRDIPHVERFIDHEIIYISRYINAAWMESLYGCFMDKDGGVYYFDFSEEDGTCYPEYDDVEVFYRSLERIRKTEEPEKVVDEAIVKQILELRNEVDMSADYYGIVSAACDAGVSRQLLYDPKTREFVCLQESGDDEVLLDDENAVKIIKLCKDNMY